MSDARKQFKRSLERTCANVNMNFGRFAAAIDLELFLIDTFDIPRSPKEIAARALDQLCVRDRRQNDQLVCLSVIEYLDDVLGAPSEDPTRRQRLTDLANLIDESAPIGELERWAKNWYG